MTINDNLYFINHISKLDTNILKLEKSYNSKMNVSGKLFLSNNLFSKLNLKTINQISNVASLPGIIGSSLAMPDVHSGYGFPIGGVAAFDKEDGVIVPGGIGFDINCGVRLIKTNLTIDVFLKNRTIILEKLFHIIPSGLGKNGNFIVTNNKLEEAIINGAKWAVEEGYGIKNDLSHCEENGVMKENDTSLVSKRAYKRGKSQFGTIGSGNHFLEIQTIDEIYNPKIASKYGIFKDQICIMIHCGSRGFGHQICTDYITNFNESMEKYNINVLDPELSCVPISSEEAQNYLKAMSCGANYAWANRQIITHLVRKTFEDVYKSDFESLDMNLLYDLSHNIVKKEKHIIDKKKETVYVHRKGATRSFPAYHQDVPKDYFSIGQPVLIPGSMGTYSYILSGCNNSMDLSFGSACHGSGRILSRTDANKLINYSNVLEELSKSNIVIKSNNLHSISSEAPEVYKSSEEVVNIIDQLNIAKKIARLKPLGVIKG